VVLCKSRGHDLVEDVVVSLGSATIGDTRFLQQIWSKHMMYVLVIFSK